MNRLAAETSPYLLQHADNPVDWYPWGEEAFAEARSRERPILLSVGYSSCHWCHVMAHESFEDRETAAVMNDLFVNVKVDREERPDVDAIYMNAVQAMTGRGGWPMTVWLTPEGKPFYAGTYFPKVDHSGMPAFSRVMAAVDEAWRDRRDRAIESAEQLTKSISQTIPKGSAVPGQDSVEAAYRSLVGAFDDDFGGFGGAPKFPQEPVLEFLLRIVDEPWAPEARDMLRATLREMAVGGIRDHLGGGFARYAVDQVWLIPHFEKMLYNNALLAHLYLRAAQLGGPHSKRFDEVARSTLDYVLRDLSHPDGGWYAAEDADSEGHEGKFYVFTKSEFDSIVGEDASIAGAYFGVTDRGNFEGSNHLHEAKPLALVAGEFDITAEDAAAAVERAKQKLLLVRNTRVRPGRDDKVITSWNGLMLRTMAEAAMVLGEPRYLQAAIANAEFVTTRLIADGRAQRSWKDGTSTDGFLDDHAAYALGLYTLYQVTGDVAWYRAAEELVETIIAHYWDSDAGLFQVADDAEALITRPKDQMDNPAPSGASLAVEALLWSSLYRGDSKRRQIADEIIRESARLAESYPTAAGHLLAVLSSLVAGYDEVAIVGPDAEELHAVVWDRYRPNLVVAYAPDGTVDEAVPLLADRQPGRAYVCEGFVCRLPVTSPGALRSELDGSRTA